MMKGLEWHFVDYPHVYKDGYSEKVLCKTVDGDLCLCMWTGDRWIEGDDWWTGCIACWAYIHGVPDVSVEMPAPSAVRS